MNLPLSKTLDPADFDQLTEELTVVDTHFHKDSPQHTMRRWEYALALHAYDKWRYTRQVGGPVYDVGGAGSPFYRMLDPYQVISIDPKDAQGTDLAGAIRLGPRLGSAVFCLSVLEHVEDLDQFCYHLSCLVAPGGLLFLTMDYGDTTGHHPLSDQDPFHFHWMRKRIFDHRLLGQLLSYFVSLECEPFGPADLTYHGPTVYDYTFASLCLQKRA